LKETKPFIIRKESVMRAYELVKANKGAAGVDQESLEDFDKNLKDNLYKIWNRLSSGSYFPPAVKAVPITKKSGGVRILGVPTVGDRIAQMVVKLMLEPEVEPLFHPDSYGYRPNKSALDAIGVTRQRCWKYDWVLEFDIKGLFDNIDHELLMKAVKHHTDNKWVILYIERWLKAPMEMEDGTQVQRGRGTPQGGVISPILSNLFLHYTFDLWMTRNYPKSEWCRYADDGLVHCRTEQEAKELLQKLNERFKVCGLELHPEKTKIVYCKDNKRRGTYLNTTFTFLGYTFRRRGVKSKKGLLFLGFTPAISKEARKSIQEELRRERIQLKSTYTLEEIAKMYNSILRGWMVYYGKYTASELYPVWRWFNRILSKWAQRKYRKLKGHKTRTRNFLIKVAERNPKLFVHWTIKNMREGFV